MDSIFLLLRHYQYTCREVINKSSKILAMSIKPMNILLFIMVGTNNYGEMLCYFVLTTVTSPWWKRGHLLPHLSLSWTSNCGKIILSTVMKNHFCSSVGNSWRTLRTLFCYWCSFFLIRFYWLSRWFPEFLVIMSFSFYIILLLDWLLWELLDTIFIVLLVFFVCFKTLLDQ